VNLSLPAVESSEYERYSHSHIVNLGSQQSEHHLRKVHGNGLLETMYVKQC
jgi:hypothetical protein